MTTIVKAANAAEFLSLVPRMLGFHPRESLVLIPFDGSRSLGAMRFDLPDDAADVDRVAATIIGMACRVANADAIALVVFTDHSSSGERMPHQALVDALTGRAHACGLHLTDALCVTPMTWASYLDDHAGGPAPEPAGVDDLPSATGDQSTGADLPPLDDEVRDAVASALASFAHAVHLVCGPDAASAPATDHLDARVDPQALAAVCDLDDLPTLFEEMLEWDPENLPPYAFARAAWCLARPALRDIALVQWCRGLSAGDDALDAQLRWESGEEYPVHLAMQMWGEGDPPDVTRLERILALVRHVASAAPEPYRAGPLATAGWIAWALGRSTHAERYALQACESEPQHGLAEIVRSFVAAGHLPDWAFRRGRR